MTASLQCTAACAAGPGPDLATYPVGRNRRSRLGRSVSSTSPAWRPPNGSPSRHTPEASCRSPITTRRHTTRSRPTTPIRTCRWRQTASSPSTRGARRQTRRPRRRVTRSRRAGAQTAPVSPPASRALSPLPLRHLRHHHHHRHPRLPPPLAANNVAVNLSANPTTTVVPGEASKLTWAVKNATSCKGAGFTVVPAGWALVFPRVTSSYSVTCTGEGGAATAMATVTVK